MAHVYDDALVEFLLRIADELLQIKACWIETIFWMLDILFGQLVFFD